MHFIYLRDGKESEKHGVQSMQNNTELSARILANILKGTHRDTHTHEHGMM